MDGQLNELEEYSFFTEFLNVASEVVFSSDSDSENFGNLDKLYIEEIDMVDVEQTHELDSDEIQETDVEMIKCIINLIELEYILHICRMNVPLKSPSTINRCFWYFPKCVWYVDSELIQFDDRTYSYKPHNILMDSA